MSSSSLLRSQHGHALLVTSKGTGESTLRVTWKASAVPGLMLMSLALGVVAILALAILLAEFSPSERLILGLASLAIPILMIILVRWVNVGFMWELDSSGMRLIKSSGAQVTIAWPEMRKAVVKRAGLPPWDARILVTGAGKAIPFFASWNFQPDILERVVNAVVRYGGGVKVELKGDVHFDVAKLPTPEGAFKLELDPTSARAYRPLAYASLLILFSFLAGAFALPLAWPVEIGDPLSATMLAAVGLQAASLASIGLGWVLVSRWWSAEAALRRPAHGLRFGLIAALVALLVVNLLSFARLVVAIALA